MHVLVTVNLRCLVVFLSADQLYVMPCMIPWKLYFKAMHVDLHAKVSSKWTVKIYAFQLHACRLQELGGYRLSLASAKEFANAFPDRTFMSALTELLLKNGRYGKKGF